jgi:plasmid stabilization system protein ParE
MNAPVILKRPAARIDMAACYAYIGERSPDAARRFRVAAESTLVGLARMPGIGARYEAENLASRAFVAPRSGGSETT